MNAIQQRYCEVVSSIESPTGKPHKVFLLKFIIENVDNPTVFTSDSGIDYEKCKSVYSKFSDDVQSIESINSKPTLREPFHALVHSSFNGRVVDSLGVQIQRKRDMDRHSGIIGYLPVDFIELIREDDAYAKTLLQILNLKIANMREAANTQTN